MEITITRKQVIEVFTYLDGFLDIMAGIEQVPFELKEDFEEYQNLKKIISEELRIELYSRLFINYMNYVEKSCNK